IRAPSRTGSDGGALHRRARPRTAAPQSSQGWSRAGGVARVWTIHQPPPATTAPSSNPGRAVTAAHRRWTAAPRPARPTPDRRGPRARRVRRSRWVPLPAGPRRTPGATAATADGPGAATAAALSPGPRAAAVRGRRGGGGAHAGGSSATAGRPYAGGP